MKHTIFIVGLLLLPLVFSITPAESQPSAIPVNVYARFDSFIVTRKVDPIGNRPAEAYGQFRVFGNWQSTSRIWAGVGQQYNPSWLLKEYIPAASMNHYLVSYIEIKDKDPGRDDRLLSGQVNVSLQDCSYWYSADGGINRKNINPGNQRGNTCVVQVGLVGRKAETTVTLEIERLQ